MRTQMEKAELFRALHERPGAFIIPNPWDAGTAKLLAAMGFEALATTSLGLANTLGSATVSRNAIIENCRAIAQATELPVNADLENCGADEPKAAADTIRLAAEAGVNLHPSTLLVFGNPLLGTQLLTANPNAGLDWPVRLLVVQDDAGDVWAVYTDFEWIARRHNIATRDGQFRMAAEVIASIASAIKEKR